MRSLILCSLLFLSATPALRADDTTPAKTEPAKTETKSGETAAYHVAPEDVLDVVVQNHEDLSKSAVVLPDGTMSYPYVGEFKASGMTLRQVSDRITTALAKEIANPQVSVTIKSLHERQPSQVGIWFQGSGGKTAGRYTLKEGWRVLDLLIEAGGLATDRDVAYTAHLIRKGSSDKIPVDLPHILSGNDTKANLPLEAGDLLVIQQYQIQPSQIQVLGDVSRSGAYPLPKDGSLIPILTAAGPLASAALSKCEITHGDKTSVVDLSSFLSQGRISPSIKLESGDTLFIPQNKLIYSVYGAVGRQGKLGYPDNQSVSALTALSNAGGQSQDADLKKASVVHPTADGKAQITPINLEDAIKKGDLSKDVTLAPGDILVIPSRRHSGTSFGLSSVLSALPFIGYFGLR